jgi:hypothetical protein
VTVTNFNQSRVKLFRRCEKQYSFRYDYPEIYGPEGEKIEMIPRVNKLPLYRGSWMHALQEALHHQWAGTTPFQFDFGQGRGSIHEECSDWREVHALLTTEFEKLFLEEREDLGDLPTECESMFKRYLKFWGADQDMYSVAEVDGKPAIGVDRRG